MKSVGKAAGAMMNACHLQFAKERFEFEPTEVSDKYKSKITKGWWTEMRELGEATGDKEGISEEEFKNKWRIWESVKNDSPVKHTPPQAWYTPCITIATDASLEEMVAPAALVMLSPLVIGIFFGKYALAGLLIGAVVSGVQVA